MSQSGALGGGAGGTGKMQHVVINTTAANTGGWTSGGVGGGGGTSSPHLGLISTGTPYTAPFSPIGEPDWNGRLVKTCTAHEAGELYEYIDGTIYVHCIVCQERIQLSAIPAWGSPEQLANIIEELAEGSYPSTELALQEILNVEEKLEAALEAIIQAKALIDIARRMALGVS